MTAAKNSAHRFPTLELAKERNSKSAATEPATQQKARRKKKQQKIRPHVLLNELKR